MKSVLVLLLASSALAAPSFDLGSFLDALFGSDNDNNSPGTASLPNIPPIGTGTGTGTGLPYPFPTATDASFPHPSSDRHVKPKALHIDYKLAPTAPPRIERRVLKYRQQNAESAVLPSFSLFDPNDTPTATETATSTPTEVPNEVSGLPTGTKIPGPPTETPSGFPGLATGYPSGPLATGEAPYPTDPPEPPCPLSTASAGTGIPDAPSTLETVTSGPKPTAVPEAPGEDDGEETENGNWWLEWITQLLTDGKGSA